MDDKTAAKVLLKSLTKYSFTKEEQEALNSAIGILSWTSLAKSGVKKRREKLNDSTKW